MRTSVEWRLMLVALTLGMSSAFAADAPEPLARAEARYREAKYDEAVVGLASLPHVPGAADARGSAQTGGAVHLQRLKTTP
jgi:hypothetical protein